VRDFHPARDFLDSQPERLVVTQNLDQSDHVFCRSVSIDNKPFFRWVLACLARALSAMTTFDKVADLPCNGLPTTCTNLLRNDLEVC
jgi:hypothetical protein